MGDEKVDVEELKKELERYKTFYENTPEEVRYFVERIGQLTRIVRRDLKDYVGILLGATFEIKTVEVGVEEEIKEYARGVKVFERKVIKIPFSNLADIEFIFDRDEQEMEEK